MPPSISTVPSMITGTKDGGDRCGRRNRGLQVAVGQDGLALRVIIGGDHRQRNLQIGKTARKIGRQKRIHDPFDVDLAETRPAITEESLQTFRPELPELGQQLLAVMKDVEHIVPYIGAPLMPAA